MRGTASFGSIDWEKSQKGILLNGDFAVVRIPKVAHVEDYFVVEAFTNFLKDSTDIDAD